MSEFFISGFPDEQPASQAPASATAREIALQEQAQMQLIRFEFGVLDIREGRATAAARSLAQASSRIGPLSHARAKQRAKSYVANAGKEHCPCCWVFEGAKRPLGVWRVGSVSTALCGTCGSQFEFDLAKRNARA